MAKPSRGNTIDKSCIPISSNCVDWEGGDIPGVKLCADDSVSEVIQKTNVIVQQLKKELNLTNLDISSIRAACDVCPEPEKTLYVILQLIINKTISLEELITKTTGSGTTTKLILPSCLRSKDENNILITELPINDFVQTVARYVCSLDTRVSSTESNIRTLRKDVTKIETDLANNTTDLSISNIQNNCLDLPRDGDGNILVTEAVPVINKKLCEINTDLGSLSTGLGTKLTPFAGESTVKKLTDSTQVLGNGTGAADTVGLWMTNITAAINDVRAAVRTIQLNCCQITCDDIIIDFDVKLSDDRQTMYLFFKQKSNLPNGYKDYKSDGNVLTITDSAGHIYPIKVPIANQINSAIDTTTGNELPFTIELAETSIDSSLDYILSMDASMTDGSTTCVKCISKTITYKNTCAWCQIEVEGTDGSYITLIYETN